MSTLVSYNKTSPYGKEENCAQFGIADIRETFTLQEILSPGEKYVFSFWVSSDSAGSLVIGDTIVPTSSVWEKHSIPFVANDKNFTFGFTTVGTYYIFHPKMEFGTVSTDWSPAPEDTDDRIDASVANLNDNVNKQFATIHESIADLVIDTDGIEASVNDIKINIDEISGKIISAQEQISSLELTSADMRLQFQDINNNGVSKVTTETGFTFDRDGMTVDSTDSTTKTQVTPDGMTVYKKDAAGGQSEVLEATSEGVDATNLHAKTYLIIGGRSRFENYGSNRTGCFWIGG